MQEQASTPNERSPEEISVKSKNKETSNETLPSHEDRQE